jgi:flagellar biosynthesis/type III secretory pathway M-ring protein FliF/YscJ
VDIVVSEPAFWNEPVALLLVLGLLAWILVRILLRRRSQPAAWPVPSLLGLEAKRPEPVSLPKPAPPLQDTEPAPVEADAEVDEETREEELELVA